MMTPDELVKELKDRGYPVTLRQLRDWREKGLLPRLKARGRGQGLGKVFYWADQGIVEHTVAVYEITKRRSRFKNAHRLELWFLGYPDDLDLVREAYLASLDFFEHAWTRGKSNADDVEDELARIASQAGRKMASETGWRDEQIDDLVRAVLRTVFSPSWRFDIAEIEEPLGQWLSQLSRRDVELPKITAGNLEVALQWLRGSLSISSVRRAIEGATYSELETAHKRWRTVRGSVQLLAERCEGQASEEFFHMGRQLSLMFGGLCICVLLWMGKRGLGRMIDANLDALASGILLPIGHGAFQSCDGIMAGWDGN
jgi:hypothetical protein